jgi:hypothetical protein
VNTVTLIKRLRDAGLISKFRAVYNDAVTCADGDEMERHNQGLESAQLLIGDTLGIWPSLDVVDAAISQLGA